MVWKERFLVQVTGWFGYPSVSNFSPDVWMFGCFEYNSIFSEPRCVFFPLDVWMFGCFISPELTGCFGYPGVSIFSPDVWMFGCFEKSDSWSKWLDGLATLVCLISHQLFGCKEGSYSYLRYRIDSLVLFLRILPISGAEPFDVGPGPCDIGPGHGLRNLLFLRNWLPLFVLTIYDFLSCLDLIIAGMDHRLRTLDQDSLARLQRLKCARGHLLNRLLTDFSPLLLVYLELAIREEHVWIPWNCQFFWMNASSRVLLLLHDRSTDGCMQKTTGV